MALPLGRKEPTLRSLSELEYYTGNRKSLFALYYSFGVLGGSVIKVHRCPLVKDTQAIRARCHTLVRQS